MKDPAVLFYFQDFLVGTEFMNDDEVGKYIRVLCHQADKGSLSESQLKRICRGEVPEILMEKLSKNGDGKYYQKRMQEEREKRMNYTESRRKNRTKKTNKICKTYDKRMENENENENINKDVIINKKEKNDFFENFRKSYPGTKRGYQVEFDNFKKKHKDWKNVLLILSDKLNYQIETRKRKSENGGFVPEWKNLQTWINQRCWEEEISTEVINNSGATDPKMSTKYL